MNIPEESITKFLSATSVKKIYPPAYDYAPSNLDLNTITSETIEANHITRRKLAGYAVNSSLTRDKVLVSVILGYQPASAQALQWKNLENKHILKDKATKEITNFLTLQLDKTYNDFDELWDEALSSELDTLVNLFHEYGENDFSYGNALKWITIATKHLYMLGVYYNKTDDIDVIRNSNLFKVMPFPIDSGTKSATKKLLGIPFTKYSSVAWSKIMDKNAIKAYEHDSLIKCKALGYNSLFEFEFNNWAGAAN